MKQRRRLLLALTAAYVLLLVAFAVRPHIPAAYAWWHGSDLGAWNMYSHVVNRHELAYVQRPDGERLTFDHTQFIWHNRFISTAHGHVQHSVVDEFAQFLAARPEILDAFRDQRGPGWSVVFVLRYRAGSDRPVTLRGEAPLVWGD